MITHGKEILFASDVTFICGRCFRIESFSSINFLYSFRLQYDVKRVIWNSHLKQYLLLTWQDPNINVK